ncbi:MAG: hypothetical protein Q9M22_05930 [Mariprofundaceae bacterium]|nr:hypothetical protein [Mariprofundaceae bacterium]
MTRIKRGIMFFSTLLVVIAMVLLPDTASQLMRMQAFGWQLEIKQGFFILLLLAALWLVYWLNALLQTLLAGTGILRGGLRSGKLNRQERQLREGIMKWVDAQGDLGEAAFNKSGHALPDWLLETCLRSNVAIADLPLPQKDEKYALSNAVVARLATDEYHHGCFDSPTIETHLQAWLSTSPDSVLAMFRLAKLAIKENNWQQASQYLQALEKKSIVVDEVLANSGESGNLHTMMASAWLAIAKEDESQRKSLLRKVRRLVPTHGPSILEVGRLMQASEGDKAVKKLWLNFLQQQDDEAIADACFKLLADEFLPRFREIEHIRSTPSFEWLKARLAHACQLNGLAEELLDRVILEHPRPSFLRTRAAWQYEKQQWDAAYATLQRALDAKTT